MKYIISDIYIRVGNTEYCVGVVLGEEDNKNSLMATEYITNTEKNNRIIDNKVSAHRYIDDLVYHQVGEIIDNKSRRYIKKKWFDELSTIIDTSKIENNRMCNVDLNKLINKIKDCETTEVSIDPHSRNRCYDTETFVNLDSLLEVINELDGGE